MLSLLIKQMFTRGDDLVPVNVSRRLTVMHHSLWCSIWGLWKYAVKLVLNTDILIFPCQTKLNT